MGDSCITDLLDQGVNLRNALLRLAQLPALGGKLLLLVLRIYDFYIATSMPLCYLCPRHIAEKPPAAAFLLYGGKFSGFPPHRSSRTSVISPSKSMCGCQPP